MKDKEGKEVETGDKFKWIGNDRVYRVEEDKKGQYFVDDELNTPSQLSTRKDNLKQMERVEENDTHCNE